MLEVVLNDLGVSSWRSSEWVGIREMTALSSLDLGFLWVF